MQFSIREIAGKQSEKYSEQEKIDIAAEISRRFSEAGYPVTRLQSAQSEKLNTTHQPTPRVGQYTHVLEVKVGAAKLTDMPPGFSLNFGNSDPRSSNFQKALTVPVTCTLAPLKTDAPGITLEELKTAPAEMENLGLSEAQICAKTKRFYIETIGSTCHNLLSKLDIYPANLTREAGLDTPKNKEHIWGGVRVKIEDDGAANLTPKKNINVDTTQMTPNSKDVIIPNIPVTSTPSRQKALPENSLQSDWEAAPNEPASRKASSPSSTFMGASPDKELSESPTVAPSGLKLEENHAKDWQKKKITIFNQGDTLILKFGYDRP